MLLADHIGRGGGDGPHPLGFLLFLLLLLLGGFLIARIIRRRRGGGSAGWHHHSSPISTLQDRFARGDIDRAEYEHRKAVLDGVEHVPPAPPSRTATVAPPAPPTAEPTTDDGDVGSGVDASDETGDDR